MQDNHPSTVSFAITEPMSEIKVKTLVAGEVHRDQILLVTNEAFMADAFFKKPDYHLRFDARTVSHMIANKNAMFIVAICDENSEDICGSLYFNWTKELLENEKVKVIYVHRMTACAALTTYICAFDYMYSILVISPQCRCLKSTAKEALGKH